MKFLILVLINLILISNANAWWQGQATSSTAFTYLAQQFSTPLEIWSTELQNSSYAGAAIRVHRTDNDVETDIPFSGGKYASVSAFNSACSGTTCLLAKVYGQMGLTDCVQATKANMQSVVVDTDSKLTIQGSVSKWCASTSTSLKIATAHCFGVFYPGYIQDTTAASYALWGYTAADYSAARWGFGLGPGNTFAEYLSRNGEGNFIQAPSYGNAMLGGTSGYHVWDYLGNTETIYFDGSLIGPSGITTATITYPATQTFYIGNDASNNALLGKWRGLACYNSVRADRVSIGNFLVSDYAVTPLPATVVHTDGFTYVPQYMPSFVASTDLYNMSWDKQSGGYPWSLWIANVSNSTTLYRYEVHPNDNDTIVNGAERTERGGGWNNLGIKPGGGTGFVSDFDMFVQFMFEPGPVQVATGGWCLGFQFHYGAGEQLGAPDMIYMDFQDEQLVLITGRDTNTTAQNSPISYSRNVWYAMRITAHISTNHTSDSLSVWLGPNGGTLTQIVNIASAGLFNTNTWDAYVKQGIYRGDPGLHNNNFAMKIANYQFSSTIGTFSSYVTTQPALPTP